MGIFKNWFHNSISRLIGSAQRILKLCDSKKVGMCPEKVIPNNTHELSSNCRIK